VRKLPDNLYNPFAPSLNVHHNNRYNALEQEFYFRSTDKSSQQRKTHTRSVHYSIIYYWFIENHSRIDIISLVTVWRCWQKFIGYTLRNRCTWYYLTSQTPHCPIRSPLKQYTQSINTLREIRLINRRIDSRTVDDQR